MRLLCLTKEQKNMEMISYLQNNGWLVDTASETNELIYQSTNKSYDVIVISTEINGWRESIITLRRKHIFTPILVVTSGNIVETDENGILTNGVCGLEDGADMCMKTPFTPREFLLRLKALQRRNYYYQIPTITFDNIVCSNEKITCKGINLSITPIEFEVMRVLSREKKAISYNDLSERIGASIQKIMFAAQCLQRKIEMLSCDIKLVLSNQYCQLVGKN